METQKILDQARQQIAQRKAPRPIDQRWLRAFIGLAATVVIGVWFLPGGSLAERLQLVVHGVCAQAHYLYVGPFQMPLCARNSGLYSGFLSTLIYLLVIGRGRAARLPSLPICALLLLGVIAMAVDGFNSMLLDIGGYNLYEPLNILRVITGLLMGTTLGAFLLLMFNVTLRANPSEKPIFASWTEYLGALLANALLFGLLWFSPGLLFYPLAIFSVIGICGVLFMSNVFVVGMISGYEAQMRRLAEIAKPATIALVLTLSELGLLAWLRVTMERSMAM